MGKDSWEMTSLSEIALLLGGGTPKRSDHTNFGNYIDWVTPSDLPPIGEVKLLGKLKEGLSKKGLSGSSAKLIRSGSVLFSSRASIGKIAVVDRDCCTNQGFVNFFPHKDKVDAWFLAFLLRYHTKDLLKLAGKTTYKEISRKKLNGFSIQLPPLKEQRRIVSRIKELLERVEEINSLRKQSLKEARYLFGNRCSELFYQDWPEKQLEQLLIRGPLNGVFKKRKDFGNGTLLVNVKDLYVDQTINFEKLERVKITDSETKKYELKPGDILVNRSSLKREGLGRSCMFLECEEPVVFECHIMRVRLNQGILKPYLFAAFMNSPIGLSRILQKAKTATMTTWNQQDLKSMMIPVPHISQQKKMVDELIEFKGTADSMRNELMKATEESRLITESILRKAFAGEL